MYKGVLLDFYGTLVHEDDINIEQITTKIHAHAPSGTAIDEIGRFWYERFFHWCAISNHEAYATQRSLAVTALRETMDAFDVDLNPEEVIAPQFKHWREAPLFEDCRPFLASLAASKTRIVVVSNVDRSDILSAIAHHGLPLEDVLTSEDAHSYKPHPGIFDLALERMGLGRGEVLHIGDSRTSDVVGARNAGIAVAWLNRTGKKPVAGPAPDIEVASLVELIPLLSG